MNLLMSLRIAGLRATPQRQFVLEALEDLQHATPTEIAIAIQAHSPSINLSTIYRTLDHLEEAGIVSRAFLIGTVPHYFLHGRGLHLVCTSCAFIECVPATPMKSSVKAVRRQHGFTVDLADVVLRGACTLCSGAAQTEPHHTSRVA